MDLKAYFSGGLLDSQINFNTGGGGISAKIAGAESGGNYKAKNPDSSAYGKYQFIDATWIDAQKALGRPLDRNSVKDQEDAQAWLLAFNTKYLKKKGIEPNAKNLYMVHFLGQGGANRFFKALQENPNAPATSFATKEEIESNKRDFSKAKTLQDFYNHMTNKVL